MRAIKHIYVATRSPPTRFFQSAIWACLAAMSFATMAVSVRYLDGKFDAFELVFVRALIGLIIIIPLVSREGLQKLKTTRMSMHFTAPCSAPWRWPPFTTPSQLPQWRKSSLTFLIPIFTTIGAGLILKETIGHHRGLQPCLVFSGHS